MKQAGMILIVEDDPYIRRDLAEILRGEGYDVVTAGEGSEALHRLRRKACPSVILLDLMMDGMNGWDFRDRQLQDPALAAIPVVILSGLIEGARHATNLAAVDLIVKPIVLDALLETVHRHCPPPPAAPLRAAAGR
jgi:CheY-like chemotaxis protein